MRETCNSFLLPLGAADHALDFIICVRVRPFFPLAHFYEHEFNLCAPSPVRYVHLIDNCQGDNSQLIDVPYKLYHWQRIDVKNIHHDADSLYYFVIN